MEKRNKIFYCIATIWLSLGMLSSGIVQLMRLEAEVSNMSQLGYPVYLMTILGVWKILGVVVILLPGFALIKEWAYSGFFFSMSGASISHIAVGDSFNEIGPTILLLLLTVVSWYFRPSDRKLILLKRSSL